ncbi:MAG: aminotransferase class I/II-fold pyridoxal phosphate-dependent enzyme [Acidimicrobiia bacterium]|nr:aminotransferase class I/II-fold pyridoxal phosphate-dependent enzyme [Acidimicrobiia bacterium]
MGTTRILDLRAEVRSRPTANMWQAMHDADFGWAQRGEDPYVNQLESRGAADTGKEACVFLATTSLANLLSAMATTSPGEQVVLEQDMHMVWMEGRNLAHITSLYPRMIASETGEMALEEVAEALTQWRGPYPPPRTSLVAVESPHNDHGGSILSKDYLGQLGELIHAHGGILFMDGARLHNAAVASTTTLADYVDAVDLVSVSLNKGIGAPYGALLCGPTEIVEEARRLQKVVGVSGVHRVGIFASAALEALNGWEERLATDHGRAQALASGIDDLSGLDVVPPQTNQVKILTHRSGIPAADLARALSERGVLAAVREEYYLKLFTYHEIDDEAVAHVIAAVSEAWEELSGGPRQSFELENA